MQPAPCFFFRGREPRVLGGRIMGVMCTKIRTALAFLCGLLLALPPCWPCPFVWGLYVCCVAPEGTYACCTNVCANSLSGGRGQLSCRPTPASRADCCTAVQGSCCSGSGPSCPAVPAPIPLDSPRCPYCQNDPTLPPTAERFETFLPQPVLVVAVCPLTPPLLHCTLVEWTREHAPAPPLHILHCLWLC